MGLYELNFFDYSEKVQYFVKKNIIRYNFWWLV